MIELSRPAQLVLEIYGWIADESDQWMFLTPRRVSKLLRPIFGQVVLDEVEAYLKEQAHVSEKE